MNTVSEIKMTLKSTRSTEFHVRVLHVYKTLNIRTALYTVQKYYSSDNVHTQTTTGSHNYVRIFHKQLKR